MLNKIRVSNVTIVPLILLLMIMISACNLGGSPDQLEITNLPTNTPQPTRTLIPTGGAPTPLPVTTVTFPTAQSNRPPTAVVVLPPTIIVRPTNTPLPVSIVILSPIPSNVVAGNVQVLGSAIHPQFLQYQVEFGPDPNPGNLWYQISGVVQVPVLNSLLGIWNTTTTPDGVYQLRLRVFLRDGSELATVVNSVRVQNRAPTPIPSNTPTIPRPIAAFTQDRTTGDAPLVVKFINQSSGNITSYSWNFGDNSSSPEANPTHNFANPGVYTVALTVSGPGGTSNVSRQINVTSPTVPVAAFTQDKTSGPSPLAVRFTNQSTGNITAYSWNFGDTTTSTEQSPSHTFTAVGTYNVILKVTGPGGSSSVTRQITVENPQIPPPVAKFTPGVTSGQIPLTVGFTDESTGQITTRLWDFNGDGITDSTETNPTHIYTTAGNFTARLTVIGPGGQASATANIEAIQPPNAPVADFTASPTSGDTPLNVTFTDASTGNITNRQWDFNGDGVTDSTDTNPSHTYNTEGTYTVKLTVTGPGGSSSKEITVTATKPIAPPIADFTANPTSGTAPLTVEFLNQSTGDNLTYAWDFDGDGDTDFTDASPAAFTYDTANTYTVTLNVSNSAGSNSKQTTITVTAAPVAPIAAFAVDPSTGNAPLTVNFSNASTGDITAYAWDFDGDGVVDSTDANPAPVNYDNPNTHTVSLTVTGPGGSNSTQQTLTVNPPAVAPTAAFSLDPASGTAPLTVAFTNTSSGDITAYAWDFNGDGVIDSTDANPAPVAYDTPNTYTVSLTVSGPGGSNSAQQSLTVNPPAVAPTAAFSLDPTSGTAPLTVSFTNTSSGDITAYAWDFNGDGVVDSTDANPAPVSYDTPNTFTVSLTVSGPGGSNSAQQSLTVNPPAVAPTAAFSLDPTSGTAPLTVSFTNTSSGDITAYAWDFNGDGVVDSTDANPAPVNYDTPNTFTVSLTVSGPGGSNSAQQSLTVNPPAVAPTAAFSLDPTSGTAPVTITFTNTSSGDITAYAWDFNGDGVIDSTDANPAPVNYDTPNTFTVSLTVSGPGGSNSAQQSLTVNSPAVAPTAAFSLDPTSGTAPLTVAFTNTSSGDITAYAWDFNGDGVIDSTDANPAPVNYDTPNTFTVSLTVSGPGGSNSAQQSLTVNAPPVAGGPEGVIAFTTNRDGNFEVYVVNADGIGLTNLTNNGADDFDPTWSPDGDQIAFVSDRSGDNDIWVMNADGSNLTQLTFDAADDNSPAWSPDGDQIAFVSKRSNANNEIFTMSAGDGSNVTQLTNDPSDDRNPAWSPDGNDIAFQSDRSNANNEIFTMSAGDGSNVTLLTNDGSQDVNPGWSPDGNDLVFVTNRDGNYEVYTMSDNGSNPTRLTFNNSNESTPFWSPDETLIVFVSDRNGNNDLFIMNADGTGENPLFTEGSNDHKPVWAE